MENVPSTGGETLADAELQVMVSKIGRLVIDNDLHQPGLDRQWQAEANQTRHSPKANINIVFDRAPYQHSPAPRTVCVTCRNGVLQIRWPVLRISVKKQVSSRYSQIVHDPVMLLSVVHSINVKV